MLRMIVDGVRIAWKVGVCFEMLLVMAVVVAVQEAAPYCHALAPQQKVRPLISVPTDKATASPFPLHHQSSAALASPQSPSSTETLPSLPHELYPHPHPSHA